MAKIEKAIIKATGKEVQVYKNAILKDKYVNANDCNTLYDKSELTFK